MDTTSVLPTWPAPLDALRRDAPAHRRPGRHLVGGLRKLPGLRRPPPAALPSPSASPVGQEAPVTWFHALSVAVVVGVNALLALVLGALHESHRHLWKGRW